MTTKKPLPIGITSLSYKLETYAIYTKIQECKITYYATVQDVSQRVYNSKYVLDVAFDKVNGGYEPCYPHRFIEPYGEEALEWVLSELNLHESDCPSLYLNIERMFDSNGYQLPLCPLQEEFQPKNSASVYVWDIYRNTSYYDQP